MKRNIRIIAILLIMAALAGCLAGCGKKASDDTDPVTASAVYTKDTELGEGEKTVKVSVKANALEVKFTIHTDREILGDALQDNKLVDGEEGEFGLYIKKVNGITADYDVDQSYWGFYINGEYAMSGVDTTEIDENADYLLEYTK